MKVVFKDLIIKSGIQGELQTALAAVVANRAVATPQVLMDFVGWEEPTPHPTNTVRNTAILARLARLIVIAQGQQV